MTLRAAFLASLIAVLFATSAQAASSGWQETTGAKLRLLARDTGNGTIEAALHIVLEDGWKTYWKVPGASGVPPQIMLIDAGSGTPLREGQDVTIRYPAPKVFSDGSGWIAGYEDAVAFPIDVETGQPVRSLRASGMVGICAEICIPVPFDLTVDVQGDAQSSLEAHRVLSQARALVPDTDVGGFSVQDFDMAGSTVRVRVPAGTQTAFWLDLMQGMPVEAALVEGTMATFLLPPAALQAAKGLVVTDAGSAVVSFP